MQGQAPSTTSQGGGGEMPSLCPEAGRPRPSLETPEDLRLGASSAPCNALRLFRCRFSGLQVDKILVSSRQPSLPAPTPRFDPHHEMS